MKHRRTRQVARLLYYYCCVRMMVCKDGRWVFACDADGVWLIRLKHGNKTVSVFRGMGNEDFRSWDCKAY